MSELDDQFAAPYEPCPKCGEDYNVEQDGLYICPRCGEEGSSACCNPGGNRTLCLDCNNKDIDEGWQ